MVPRKEESMLGFPKNVFILSLVSFFNDIGGETIKRAIPLYLANILGVKTGIIGLIEGVADSTPQIFQPVAGYLSDLSKKRKPLIIFGQILRSIMIFLFWATTWPTVLFLRFLDRSGKGITNAPRDALIADSSSPGKVGRSFGLNRAMDNGGAVFGMILAGFIALGIERNAVYLTHGTFQRIVLLAVVPLAIALALIGFFVKDIPGKVEKVKIEWKKSIGKKYYIFLILSFLFTLGNSSDAFLVLKAQQVGITLWQIFFLLGAYSLVSALSGLPLSSLSDTLGRKKLLFFGWFLYAVVYFLYARAANPGAVVSIFFLYGLYYGFTEGAAKALIADITLPEHRGTAYGMYNLVVGGTLFPASLIAGYLWQTFAPSAAFYFGSGMAAVAALGLVFFL